MFEWIFLPLKWLADIYAHSPTVASLSKTLLIIALSAPFAVFAAVTTFLALFVLWTRLLLALIEGSYALAVEAIHRLPNLIHRGSDLAKAKSSTRKDKPKQDRSPKSRRPSQTSTIGSGFLTNMAPKNISSATLAGPYPPRDYEGVGGWRYEEDDDNDEALWMGPRHHRRRFTGSRPPSGYGSPERVRTPLAPRTPMRMRRRESEVGSPEEYFGTSVVGLHVIETGGKSSGERDGTEGAGSMTDRGRQQNP